MNKQLLSFLVLFVYLAGALRSPAMETDQYNLPPVPLADIAPEVEAYIAENIQTAVDKLNVEIERSEACTNKPVVPNSGKGESFNTDGGRMRPNGCRSESRARTRLIYLRSSDAVAEAVYEELGTGTIFHSKLGTWMTSHKFEHEPSRYKAPYTESIYWERPINYATLSPTIRMYGVEFGTDKLDHLFQQGYSYYRKYSAAVNEGRSEPEALKAAVEWGRSTENLFYGYAVSGVYSNADLAANLAGLKFYQSLANTVVEGDMNKAQRVKLRDGKWVLAGEGTRVPAAARTTQVRYLEPFISDHLSEAYNPSNYLPLLYPLIKAAVKKHACSEWRAAFPGLDAAQLNARIDALRLWNGLDYGYKLTTRQVRVGDVCFSPEMAPKP